MNLRGKAEAEADADATAAVQGKLDAERKAHAATRRQLLARTDRVGELERLMARYVAINPGDMAIPKWITPRPQRNGPRRATALLVLSDLHLDEVVDRHEMAGLNAYDREIARARLARTVESVVKLSSTYVAGVHWDGLVVALNGDIITGDIHDELARTNVAPVPASIAYWVPKLASALTHLADTFGRVHVPCVDGNHDRTYKQIPAKKRAESSNAWVIFNWLADLCRDDERITFAITTAESQVYPIYETTFHQVHGDAFRSAGGVGGLYPSLLKYLLRMDHLWSSHGKAIDMHLLGHWHQLIFGPNFTVNGSTKGYDEYAKRSGFGFERPQQALMVVTPENGVTQRMPVFCDG